MLDFKKNLALIVLYLPLAGYALLALSLSAQLLFRIRNGKRDGIGGATMNRKLFKQDAAHKA